MADCWFLAISLPFLFLLIYSLRSMFDSRETGCARASLIQKHVCQILAGEVISVEGLFGEFGVDVSPPSLPFGLTFWKIGCGEGMRFGWMVGYM